MTSFRKTIAAALLLGGLALAAPAAAQDVSMDPTYGVVSLRSGFTPDPMTRAIRAGGSINAAQTSTGCTGYIARAPDFRVNFTAGTMGLPLIFSVSSSSDTTLVVNAPNGQWYCDDDGGNVGRNPMVRFATPASGQYDIWVGTYAAGALQQSVLHISEETSQ